MHLGFDQLLCWGGRQRRALLAGQLSLCLHSGGCACSAIEAAYVSNRGPRKDGHSLRLLRDRKRCRGTHLVPSHFTREKRLSVLSVASGGARLLQRGSFRASGLPSVVHVQHSQLSDDIVKHVLRFLLIEGVLVMHTHKYPLQHTPLEQDKLV